MICECYDLSVILLCSSDLGVLRFECYFVILLYFSDLGVLFCYVLVTWEYYFVMFQ